jgi:hypothetical protein
MNTLGNGQTQWDNVFNNQATMNAPTGNGLWSSDLTQNVSRFGNDSSNGSLMQGGRRRRRKTTRRGGNFMGAIGQAAVPFGLIALQRAFSKRTGKKGGRKSKKMSKWGGRNSGRNSRRNVKGIVV